VKDAALQALLDRQEIIDLLIRYATALDSRNWSLLRTCFTPDAIACHGERRGLSEGLESIIETCRGALSGLDSSQHLLSNFVIELIDSGSARAASYLHAQHVLVSHSGLNTFVVAGTYRDSLVRTSEGWRIVHRTLETTWTDGNAGLFAEAAARWQARSTTVEAT
jgi:3-phenylpropionate/cinnamic acid dioxygenase small subunit